MNEDIKTTTLYEHVLQPTLRSTVKRLAETVRDFVTRNCHSDPKILERKTASYLNTTIAGEKELAGRQGFEPRSGGPEPPVLPLDDLPAPTAILK